MTYLTVLINTILAIFAAGGLALPLYWPFPHSAGPHSTSLPVVLWHGLGDSYDSPGMIALAGVIKQVLGDDAFVYRIRLDESGSKDQQASLFGNLNDELEEVHEQLMAIPELQDGFNAIGFSQGGLFLRAYNERYGRPYMHTLVTFGSPHNGIADLPACQPREFLCRRRNQLLRGGVWTDYAQTHITSAQYFRNPEHLDIYREKSRFLADINNERDPKHINQTYADNMAQLQRLVLVMFDRDDTVVPKQSAWFQEFNVTSYKVTPLTDRDLYQQDWLGLKRIPNIDYLLLPGVHMEIAENDFADIVEAFLKNNDDETNLVAADHNLERASTRFLFQSE